MAFLYTVCYANEQKAPRQNDHYGCAWENAFPISIEVGEKNDDPTHN